MFTFLSAASGLENFCQKITFPEICLQNSNIQITLADLRGLNE